MLLLHIDESMYQKQGGNVSPHASIYKKYIATHFVASQKIMGKMSC